MIVYRICKMAELKKIFEDNNFTNVGYNFSNSDLNTHNYNKSSKYLHFFLNKDSIFYLRTLKDRFICVYDIPEYILNRYKGIGYYWDYINYRTLNEVIEYAIENNVIDLKFLKRVSYIKCDVEFEEYLVDNNMTNFTEIIYTCVDDKKLVLKKFCDVEK